MKYIIITTLVLLMFGCNINQNEKSGTEGDSKSLYMEQNQYANIPILDTLYSAEEPHEFRPWQLEYFTDENGNQTDEKYIKFYTSGFVIVSDTDLYEYLYVKIIVTKSAAGLFLHRYGSNHPVKRLNGNVTFILDISKDEEYIIEIDNEWSEDGGFRIEDKDDKEKSYFTDFLNYLKNSPEGFSASFEDESLSDYSFYIAADGFSEEFSLLR